MAWTPKAIQVQMRQFLLDSYAKKLAMEQRIADKNSGNTKNKIAPNLLFPKFQGIAYPEEKDESIITGGTQDFGRRAKYIVSFAFIMFKWFGAW